MFKFEEINKVFKGDFWEKSFTALDNISFDITPGKITGFLGANGAGKTTSIKILLGLIKQSSGRISFDPSLGKTKKERFRHIGYLPERPYFYPDLTGREFLKYIEKLNDLDSAEAKKEVCHWAEALKIEFALDRKLRLYSKGMLQRLGFLSTLIKKPSLLILDEPLAGLDPVGRKEFKDIMISILGEKRTIFFSSHIIHDVEEVCSDVVILEKGKLLYSGEVEELIQNYSEKLFEVELSQNINLPENLVQNMMKRKDKVVVLTKEEDLNDLISNILSQNGKLKKVTKKTPTLEEIVYKVY